MILLGNSFPFSLIRRPVRICPASLEELQAGIAAEGFVSYWGHKNTLTAASEVLGHDPTPRSEREALTLNADGLPMLSGRIFQQVWVLSPNYPPGFRPAQGVEVALSQIIGWQILRLDFETRV